MSPTRSASFGAGADGGTLASWTTQQLVSFLGAVSTCRDEADAVRTAAEAVALATDAEIGAVILDGELVSGIGFGHLELPVAQLLEVCRQPGPSIEVAGVGRADICVAALGGSDSYLIAARIGEEFGAGERAMINAMAQVLNLTLDLLRSLGSERAARQISEHTTAQVSELLTRVREQRQLTLDRFSRIQRAIAARSQLQDVLDAIATTAGELVDCDLAMLRMTTPDLVSAIGLDAGERRLSHRRTGTGIDAEGIGARALRLGHPLVDNTFAAEGEASQFGDPPVQAALAVPVCHGENPIGFLMLGSREPGHHFSQLEESLAVTLAEHAALAVQDAETVSKLHDALSDAVHKAAHDALTGLANRATFLSALDAALIGAHRADRLRPCVMYVDLDYFKVVNDTYGHQIGDELLAVTAARLRAAVRPIDLVARLGGDEFAVLLGGVDDDDHAAELAQRVYTEVARSAQLDAHTFYPSASIGVAPAQPDDTSAGVLNRADLALYEAKRLGRGRVSMYHPILESAQPIPSPRSGAHGIRPG